MKALLLSSSAGLAVLYGSSPLAGLALHRCLGTFALSCPYGPPCHLALVGFQFTLCYGLGRLFGCSVLTELILAYRRTLSTKIVHKNKIVGNATLVLYS